MRYESTSFAVAESKERVRTWVSATGSRCLLRYLRSGFIGTRDWGVSFRGIRGHRGVDAYRQRNFFCTSFGQNVRTDVVGPDDDLPSSLALMLVFAGFLTATALTVLDVLSGIFLPRMAHSSEDQFGVLGLMFTFVGWLFVYSTIVVTAACISSSFSRDAGSLGAWLRSSPTGEGHWFCQKD